LKLDDRVYGIVFMGPHLPLAALVGAHSGVGLVGAHFVIGYWGRWQLGSILRYDLLSTQMLAVEAQVDTVFLSALRVLRFPR